MEKSVLLHALLQAPVYPVYNSAMKLTSRTIRIRTSAGKLKLIILSPRAQTEALPGILWIHGGGFATGMAAMVHISAGRKLAEKFGAVLISPGYRLSWQHPYPAAADDCYAALEYLYTHADELKIRRDRIIVGGESAGGGLAAAVCLMARDRGKIPVAYQLPLYPMLDCYDTPSSRDNHGFFWNTVKNHKAWKLYLGPLYGKDPIPKYASPARETDYRGLPPAYTFVCDGEPFYEETLTHVRKLREAGVPASVDVYHGKAHAFDMMLPWTENARNARKRLCDVFEEQLKNGFQDREGKA